MIDIRKERVHFLHMQIKMYWILEEIFALERENKETNEKVVVL